MELLQLKLVYVAQSQVEVETPLVVEVVVLGSDSHQVRLDDLSVTVDSLGLRHDIS